MKANTVARKQESFSVSIHNEADRAPSFMDLPHDVRCLIFEIAAFDQETALACALVSKDVNSWYFIKTR